MTTPITAIGGVSNLADQPSNAVDNPGATLDRNAFLKLLVAQLKYQDPTKPADSSQLVAQSAQLTMVDRLNDIAELLDSAAASNRLSLAGTIVGKEVTFVDEDGYTQSARVDAVRVENGEVNLTAGNFSVPLSAVTVVRQPISQPASLGS